MIYKEIKKLSKSFSFYLLSLVISGDGGRTLRGGGSGGGGYPPPTSQPKET